MQNHIKLKRQIEETFKIKCNSDCKYIFAVSSEELGMKIQEKLQMANNVICYEFLTNSCLYFNGKSVSKLGTITDLGENITAIKVGYMEITIDTCPEERNESFVFCILDSTKDSLKFICSPGESKKVELSTYNDFASLQDAFINIIGKKENLKHNWKYMILRENKNSFGTLDGADERRIKCIVEALENIKKHSEYITAVSIQRITDNKNDKKDEELKHYVLFMV
jgi:hypothetical protein